MRSLVYLEVLAARKHFSAAGKQTRKRFFAGVNADVVDQLVLGLERTKASAAVEPQTHVDALIGRPDVFQTNMRNEVVHRIECSAAARSTLHPATDHLLLDGCRRS